MAPLLFRDLKGISCSSPAATAIRPSLERRLSCSTPASTAICPSLERLPMVRSHKAIASSASHLSQAPTTPRTHRHDGKKGQQHKVAVNATGGGGLVSPANSSRYLLSGPEEEIQEVESAPPADAAKEEAAADAKSTHAQEQVVVLKVSLHCKACAGKVKKHLSKMEGVKSFDIDFTAKKVTVVGDLTPLGVLNSVSKVKNAQLWAAPPAIAA
ncbi:hypothetical protein EJB05_03818 [Eragrostis curvula]|uniref:HMA domain-containing protein n=1 Tax=Eragrostis curvula TaxID=38414 RepID=A0A5J9W8S4_9POAL|nr:hypothetical protein EJB05_03818 [Eragrostis curvula]